MANKDSQSKAYQSVSLSTQVNNTMMTEAADIYIAFASKAAVNANYMFSRPV